MATTYDKASLVMIPSGYKDDKLYSVKPTDGSGDFTFSRDGAGASPATRVNASGLIEKGRENLLLQSNNFDTTWVAANATLTSGQSGYDGSSDAWLFNASIITTDPRLQQTSLLSGVNTFSIYAKAGSVNWVALANPNDGAYFDLANGVVGSSVGTIIDKKITSVGGGWYKCSITMNTTSSLCQVYIASADNSVIVNAGDNIYIQDAQLEQGLVATAPAIETTTAAVSAGLLGDMPRLDYSGGATCPSLLLEPSRVNSLANSEYIGGSGWTKLASTTSYNEITTPEGVDNSVKLKPNNGITFSIPSSGIFTAGASSYVRSNGITLTATDYTFSVFVKKGDFDHLQLRSGTDVDLTANATTNLINLNDGTASVANSVEEFGNGWYRVSLTFTATAATWYVGLWFWNTTSVTANGSQGVYAYGAQLESGSYPTSYIPTYGSASTRAEDYADNAGDASVFNDTEGVLYLESSWLSTALGTSTIAISDGTSSNRIILGYIGADDDLYCTSVGGGSSPSLMRYDVGDITTNHKIAIKYKANDFAFWVDGVERGTQSSGTTPVGLSELSFSSGAGGSKIFGNAKQILYFPTALTDAELASLTTL